MRKRALGEGPREAKAAARQRCHGLDWGEELRREGFAEGPVLSDIMKKRWSEGKLSAADIQELCGGAVRQGCNAEGVFKMACLGGKGQHKQNASRDFLSFLGPIGAMHCSLCALHETWIGHRG